MKTTIAKLLLSLEDKDPDVRAQGASDCRKTHTKDPNIIGALIRRLKDDESQVRLFAALALGEIGGKRAIKPLLASLVDPTFPNANPAANALGQIGDSTILPRIITVLAEHPDGHVRRSATVTLAYLKDSRAVPPLVVSLLGDPNMDVRIEAAIALGYIGDSRALEPLNALIQVEKDPSLRRAAEDAAKAILSAREKP